MIELSLAEARRLAVSAQLLDGTAPRSVTEIVRALGSVQVDPVAAVARAERMVLFSRLGPYDVSELAAALDRGELFEYWAHIVPSSDYGIQREAMRRFPRGDRARARYVREWLAANAASRRYVLRELRRRGPLLSRDLGRVDATFDRGTRVLRVDGVWAERGAPAGAGPDVADALHEMATWLGAKSVQIGSRTPRAWAKALRA